MESSSVGVNLTEQSTTTVDQLDSQIGGPVGVRGLGSMTMSIIGSLLAVIFQLRLTSTRTDGLLL
jgi:hypothetical protein